MIAGKDSIVEDMNKINIILSSEFKRGGEVFEMYSRIYNKLAYYLKKESEEIDSSLIRLHERNRILKIITNCMHSSNSNIDYHELIKLILNPKIEE